MQAPEKRAPTVSGAKNMGADRSPGFKSRFMDTKISSQCYAPSNKCHSNIFFFSTEVCLDNLFSPKMNAFKSSIFLNAIHLSGVPQKPSPF